MKELMKRAKALGSRVDTIWAEIHVDAYQSFADELEALYAEGKLTGKEFNDLAVVAFYDYYNMKEED